ncbi:hypothetical protein PSHT_03150 [Puccinia striiformis]|uniref:Sec39 domain-containing protein n=1 Tax=Puccinia striiformis TaxID=27350 RepID=A0A2S4WGC9_9BASI|nr:hypothetical protein PSHT_03150 [Puccinia striiformis]
MDRLEEAISQLDWTTAERLAKTLEIEPCFIPKHILSHQLAKQESISISSLEIVLEIDPIWVARLITNLLTPSASSSTYSYPQEHKLINILSKSTDLWLDKLSAPGLDFSLKEVLIESVEDIDDEKKIERVRDLIKENEEIAEACSAKWFSVQAESRWKIYNEVYEPEQSHQITDKSNINPDDDELDETADWGGLELDPIEDLSEAVDQSEPNRSFLSFLHSDLDELALLFASQLQLDRLRRLLGSGQLNLDSITLFDAIPLHARPSDLDYGQHLIALLPRPILKPQNSTSPLNVISAIFGPAQQRSLSTDLTDQQLTDWYLLRVEAIDQFTGCIDAAIEIIQHGAASGVPGLESIAEDLSLLAKLLYDAPYSSSDYDWTLEEWTLKSPDEIVKAYLAGSSPSSLIKDIHRLVLPYLGVLESRRARASIPGAESTIQDSLRTWALSQSNHLPMLEALIKASSPTLKLPERPIKSNEDLARILVACLYTSSSVEEWECMGRMFECMPAFPDNIPSSEEFNSAAYLHGLFTSTTGSTIWTSEGTTLVYNALSELDTGRLSSILDGLDDHLSTAEVLARWNVPARLADLVLRFHGNKTAQQKLATKIARQEGGIEMESEEEWEVLLEAMIELSQPGRALDLLDQEEITKLFFAGLLTSGKFKLAKSLFSSTTEGPSLDASTQEELVIAASREFYDNAESGNLHTREMKMAYDCLTVVPQTLKIKRERDFIEATSRLASFKIESQAGILMSPIEFRLKPNKLELIEKVLEVNRTAYQHQEMIIDLVNKLGYGEDSLIQIKALSMVIRSAIGEGNITVGSETCERMISILEGMKKRSRQYDQVRTLTKVEEASEVVWKTCEEIGRYTGIGSSQACMKGFRIKFMAHAIIICPADQIPRLLVECREAEAEEEQSSLLQQQNNQHRSGVDRRSDKISRGGSILNSIELEKSMSDSNLTTTTTTGGGNLVGIPGGVLASRTLERAASLFPFKSKTLPPSDLHQSSSSKHPSSNRKSNLSSSLGSTTSYPDRSLSSDTPSTTSPPSNVQPERDFSLPLNNLLDQSSLTDDTPSAFNVGLIPIESLLRLVINSLRASGG